MGLSITDLFTSATDDQWKAKILQIATMVGLDTTAWQSGQWSRSVLAYMSKALAGVDQVISTMAQGGFLESAAAVTPDPSVTPGAAPGWLDFLADSFYDVQREPATYATGAVNVINGSAGSYGPFPAGSYHVANPVTGATYSNVSTLTILPGTQSVTFAADIAGSASTSGPTAISQAVTALVSVTVSNPSAIVGANAESNADLVARCRLKLQSLSPDGAAGAYEFFALTASALLGNETPALVLSGGPITRAIATQDITTGVVTVTLANRDGVPSGASKLVVTDATNSTPIAVTTSTQHHCTAGDAVIIAGVQGNAAANGTFRVTGPLTADTFRLLNLDGSTTTGSGAWTGGGVVEAGDVGLVDTIIQKNAVPDSVTEITRAAAPHLVTVVVDVWVPSANATAVVGAVQTAVTNYFAALPIGGLNVNAPNIVPFDAVLATALKAATYIQQATLTLNGGTSDITLATSPVPEVAQINGTITVNVHPL